MFALSKLEPRKGLPWHPRAMIGLLGSGLVGGGSRSRSEVSRGHQSLGYLQQEGNKGQRAGTRTRKTIQRSATATRGAEDLLAAHAHLSAVATLPERAAAGMRRRPQLLPQPGLLGPTQQLSIARLPTAPPRAGPLHQRP